MSEKKSKKQEDNACAIDKLIDATFLRLKDVIDANTIIGNIIKLSDSMSIIPISKVSVGLISGGGELPSKKASIVSGVATTGFNITPTGFVTINNGIIDYIVSSQEGKETNKVVELILSMLNKYISQQKEDEVYEE